MDKKKLSAAMAAVYTYIRTAEEASCFGGVAEPVQDPPVKALPARQNLWGISGRQTHMQANSMMQLRVFK